MNIAILSRSLPPGPEVGGARLQALGWARHLARSHRVTVLTPLDSAGPPQVQQRDGFTVVRCGLEWEPTVLRCAFTQPRRPLRLPLDILRLGICVAQISPRPDVLLCFGTFMTGFAGVRVGHRLGIPAVVWIRGQADYRLSSSIGRRVIAPWVWARASAVMVQTEIGRADLLASLGRVSTRRADALQKKLYVVGTAVDLPTLVPRNPDGPVLSLGRLVRAKGMDVVVDACAAVGRPLVIAGRGPERDALERRALATAADVRFTGFVEGDELRDLYRQASAVVLASFGEGLPNVVLEGMAHARPVVATPVGGVASVIQDGVNGLLVPPGEPAALATALRKIAADPAAADRLGANGRASVEKYGWHSMRPRLEAVLASAIHGHPRRS